MTFHVFIMSDLFLDCFYKEIFAEGRKPMLLVKKVGCCEPVLHQAELSFRAFSAFPCRRQNLGTSPSLWSFIKLPVYSHLSCTEDPGGAGEVPCRETA